MAGPATHINYISDDGTTYRVLVPNWQKTFTGDATATATVGLPKGYQRRHRLLKGDTTGREYRVTVGDVTKAAWTSGIGAAVASPPVIPGSPDAAFHYAGRIGERDLERG
jgi:hypothetical protein